MGFFKKKKKEETEIPRLPELPKLPELPEFRGVGESEDIEEDSVNSTINLPERPGQISQLPSFPSSNLGNKFSQDTIKEAVTGKREVREVGADEFAEEEKMQMMQKPLLRDRSISPIQKTESKETGPIFIRIDKFEEGSQTFDEVQKRISKVENMLNEVKKIKEKEDKELLSWEDEIKQIKEKMEIIDKNIFSN